MPANGGYQSSDQSAATSSAGGTQFGNIDFGDYNAGLPKWVYIALIAAAVVVAFLWFKKGK